ncbi:hypothetical protein M758_3G221500 [Ceratodon purpureus]|nr:hypothetical protein M758_3G221500 [Ceratodon purpureus]
MLEFGAGSADLTQQSDNGWKQYVPDRKVITAFSVAGGSGLSSSPEISDRALSNVEANWRVSQIVSEQNHLPQPSVSQTTAANATESLLSVSSTSKLPQVLLPSPSLYYPHCLATRSTHVRSPTQAMEARGSVNLCY